MEKVSPRKEKLSGKETEVTGVAGPARVSPFSVPYGRRLAAAAVPARHRATVKKYKIDTLTNMATVPDNSDRATLHTLMENLA